MPTLQNSRGKFYEIHRQPRDKIFWEYYYSDILGKQLDLSEHDRNLLNSWKPERSNCPNLTAAVENLIEHIPIEWRAQAKNIFIGVVLDGEVNANAWTRVQAGIVEVNVQYIFIVSNYVIAFDHFRRTLSEMLKSVIDSEDGIEELVESLDNDMASPWMELDESRPEWMDRRLIIGGNPALLNLVPPDRVSLCEDAADACEQFVVAHELAHHLLGHTVSRTSKISAKRTVDRAIDKAGLWETMSQLNESQKQELHADILAFMMMANCIDERLTFGRMYWAMIGSVLALVAVAHVNDTWIEFESNSSHPGFTDRYAVLCRLVNWLSKDCPRSPDGDHPLGLLAQLCGFSSIAFNAWLRRASPERAKRVTIIAIADHALKLAKQAGELIPGGSKWDLTI